MTTGTIIGPALGALAHELARRSARFALELFHITHVVGQRLLQRSWRPTSHASSSRSSASGAYTQPRVMISGLHEHFAGLHVDGRHDRDHDAFLGQLRVGRGARRCRRHPRCRRRTGSRMARGRPGRDRPTSSSSTSPSSHWMILLALHAHQLAELGVGDHVPVLAVDRDEPLGVHDRQIRLDVVGLRVARSHGRPSPRSARPARRGATARRSPC